MRYFNSKTSEYVKMLRLFGSVPRCGELIISGSEAVLLDAAMIIDGWGRRSKGMSRKEWSIWEQEHNVGAGTMIETALSVAARARGEI